MSEAVRASRTIPTGSWFGSAERGNPVAMAQPVRAVRRVAREAGRLSVADPARQPLAGAALRHPRGPAMLASAALHAALLAALLLTARTVPLREPDEAAVPLLFEPTPDLMPATPLADASPPASPHALAPAGTPEMPAPAASPVEAAPASPLAEPAPATSRANPMQAAPVSPPDLLSPPRPAAMPNAAALRPALSQPRAMPAPPPVRPVPHLPPRHLAGPTSQPAARSDSTVQQAPSPPQAEASRAWGELGPAAGSQAARAEGPSVPPRPLAGSPGNVQPAYPEQARRRGIEGRVVVRATVSPAGRVVGMAVAQGSGSDALDRAALEAVRGYSFTPATRGGAAVDGVADLPFTFRLAE